VRTAIGLASFLLAASFCFASSPPKAAKSQYLRTTGAGFLLSKVDGAIYAMNYEVRKPLPSRLFCIAEFDNPEAPETPLRKEFEVSPDAADIQIQSPGVHSIQNNTKYKVRLILYLDADHTKKLSQHDQEVLFSMPPEILDQLLEKFGLKVQ
jgi:hypothetical protein